MKLLASFCRELQKPFDAVGGEAFPFVDEG
jgi:hypothetical protein